MLIALQSHTMSKSGGKPARGTTRHSDGPLSTRGEGPFVYSPLRDAPVFTRAQRCRVTFVLFCSVAIFAPVAVPSLPPVILAGGPALLAAPSPSAFAVSLSDQKPP